MARTKAKPKSAASKSKSTPRAKAKSKARAKAKSTRPDSKTKFTDNPTVIRKWVEARGGTPATVKGTTRGKSPAGILRIDFPGYTGENTLKAISWDDFITKFDEADLAFVYQKQTADGSTSRFCKFVDMDTAEDSGALRVKGPTSTSKTSSPKSGRGRKAKTTQSHRVIRKWAEARGGTPSTVKGTRKRGDGAGILRIDFPGYAGAETLKAIPWDEFFAKFDESDLLFLYQEQTADGSTSRFCKFLATGDD